MLEGKLMFYDVAIASELASSARGFWILKLVLWGVVL
jgi:hypothetical protein